MGTCAPVAVRDVMCEVCSRTFRRQSDKARHKCMEERRKPIREQQGAIQCSNCLKWFRRIDSSQMCRILASTMFVH